MLELDDIQHFLLTRPPATAARYVFLAFREASEGRRWLAGLIDKVGCGKSAPLAQAPDGRWVTIAFTWSGLRALGVSESSLATFPEEFRQGMAARAEVLGDTGANHPDRWVDGLASPSLHAIVILFARDVAERERCVAEYEKYASALTGVDVGLDTRPRGDAAVRLCPRSFRIPRSTVTAGDRGNGRGAHARFGRAVEARRVFPRLPRRGRPLRAAATTRDLVA